MFKKVLLALFSICAFTCANAEASDQGFVKYVHCAAEYAKPVLAEVTGLYDHFRTQNQHVGLHPDFARATGYAYTVKTSLENSLRAIDSGDLTRTALGVMSLGACYGQINSLVYLFQDLQIDVESLVELNKPLAQFVR